ncbi:MAG: hypothetical protein JWM11_90 [Planctomycetaceae bacterium]|nr:hypothetical protein [Planctomycetaceae bacterium]
MDVLTIAKPRERLVVRVAGILFGVATHLFFAVTVWYLYPFLVATPGIPSANALWIDSCLALQFAVTHSLWLWPPVRQRLGRWISRSFYGCFFCLMTCFSLGLTIWQWRSSSIVIWHTSGILSLAMQLGFIGSWIGLFYSLALTGIGYQTGLTEWLYWVRRRTLPRRTFVPRGAYFILRHPVYLSFLGLIWFTPTMSLDHALLTGIWTVYIFIGSWLKDRRLAFYLGESYREYAAEVPGYPGMLYGPLALWSRPTPAEVPFKAHALKPISGSTWSEFPSA